MPESRTPGSARTVMERGPLLKKRALLKLNQYDTEMNAEGRRLVRYAAYIGHLDARGAP